MLRIPAIFFALLLTMAVPAQRTISGTVVDVSTGQPMAGASVFINNTSKGTVSDKNGFFQMTDLPEGQQELIVSSVGYETNAFSFSSEKLPMKLKVEMQVKVRELENVMVEPSVMEGWEQWGQTFTDHFIGTTPNSARCKIKNYKKIRFRYFKKSNRVIAWCDEPLVIENKALGYTLHYQLENFEMDFKKNMTTFAGYPFFEDHAGAGKKVRNRWVSARDKVYRGSMMEFWRSVHKNTLEQDGYEVRRMRRTPNFEKERVRGIYKGHNMVISIRGNQGPATARKTDSPAVKLPANDTIRATDTTRMVVDSSGYYERILREKDYIDTYSFLTLTADSIVLRSEGAYRLVWFSDYLFITYKREMEDPMYLENYMEKRSPTFQRSHIWLTSGEAIVVDRNGSYSPPQEVFAMSYWSWSEKIANLLPIDYRAGE